MKGVKILIIDASAEIRGRLAANLMRQKVVESVKEADTIRSALERMKGSEFNLVVVDIHLPDGNGVDLISKIRENQKSAVVIIITQHPYEWLRKKCLKAGADYFFDNPGEIHKINEVIDALAAETLAPDRRN